MFELKQSEIDDKVCELLHEAIADDDILIDALIHCLPQIRGLYFSPYLDVQDKAYDLESAIDRHIINYHELEAKARDALIVERGTVKRVDVDDYIFVLYDTRY